MYEPTWVSPGKLASAWAESAATILTATGLLVTTRARQQSPHRSRRSLPRKSPLRRRAVALPVRSSPNRISGPGKIHSLACAHRAGRNPEGTITMTSTKHKANKEESKCRIRL
jgi:hypothetical protein